MCPYGFDMNKRDANSPVVAFLLGSSFSYTETFLFNQMRSLVRYRSLTLCSRIVNENRFPWEEPRVIGRPPAPLEFTLRWAYGRALLDSGWKKAIQESGASVLHGQFGTNGLIAAMYGKQLRLPVVTSFYGGDVGILLEPWAHLRQYWYYLLGKRALFAGTNMFLVLSCAMRDDLVKLGCPESKIRIHPNGVDLERFRPVLPKEKRGPITAIMCGREVEKKGFSYGFRALLAARRAGIDLRVKWLPAPGPLGQALRAEIRELGLDAHVDILDPASDPALVMRECDLILCPSVTAVNGDKEGVPTVLVEAAATGLPAVASLHAGIPEIVMAGETGLLYPERDIEGLTMGLIELARDDEKRARMGEAARRKVVEMYDARKLADTLETYYDELRELDLSR
jgi:colanic acid/amylovoran biosynthesis glycosyltransferase